ncbi:MAG TPA: nitroreductase/quinone reductase family protein [Anaerolineales bacterium]|nr:nitroreductase/quinone reductase family protein [Anaerolineales bacterium]
MPAPIPDELKLFNQTLITEFRMNGGNVDGWDSLLLLNTLGAKSNRPHTTPLRYSIDGDRLIIIAAAVGSPKHPAWYHNLVAHPNVIVELHGEQYHMHAVVAEGKERERLFNQHVKQSPATLEYQEMVSRQFPVVILEPITGEPSWAAS